MHAVLMTKLRIKTFKKADSPYYTKGQYISIKAVWVLVNSSLLHYIKKYKSCAIVHYLTASEIIIIYTFTKHKSENGVRSFLH